MKTYHIHIGGLVQGVGFRPHVFRIAKKYGLNGRVINTKDGVHIEVNSDNSFIQQFFSEILQSAPQNAVITSKSLKEVLHKDFSGFSIRTETDLGKPDLLLTPDFALCDECRKELSDKNNKRYHYPFTTCLKCGPRYSITTALPYDRQNTTMSHLEMCTDCNTEYNDVYNRRHFSQTNSCPDCTIPMQMNKSSGKLITHEIKVILEKLNTFLNEGSIAAVKGIGGYLLLCDANNESAIQTLRERKHRPAKPFALLYAGIDMVNKDVLLSDREINQLKDKSGPIVLCLLKSSAQKRICKDAIAPGLDKIGLMLPSSPLLQLIVSAFGKPLIATSANISGSPIIYKDDEAIELLSGIADYIISYDRDIVQPQDDSVIQFTTKGQRIILRRSRGLAPNYFPNPFEETEECIMAMGGELKSAFALQNGQNLYISQYLGNQENLLSQKAFLHTANQMHHLLQTKPSLILADKHPGYFVSQHGSELAMIKNIPYVTVQHHKAHFGAVLAENNLLNDTEPILGVIWDGTGLGDDKQIWGSEFFIYEDGDMHRVAQLEYFPHLLGDKMSREPRLSALSLLQFLLSHQSKMKSHFSQKEWQYYQQLIKQPASLLTSSMGRFLDGIASILGICDINTYEGEAAMKLEAFARSYPSPVKEYYPMPFKNNRIDFALLLQEMFTDINENKPKNFIAKKIFYSLALMIGRISENFKVKKLAFSGGVFQNALLTDMILEMYSDKLKLFWHRHLSPNDECIGFGQIACYHLMIKNDLSFLYEKESMKLAD